MTVEEQIQKGLLISPRTKNTLVLNSDSFKSSLVSNDSQETFPVINGVPILLFNQPEKEFHNSDMDKEYRQYNDTRSLFSKVKHWIYGNLDLGKHRELLSVFDEYTSENLLLGVGGGPVREYPLLTNLNIDNYPNVDIVADAHALPYRDGVVDAIHASAVLEHLYNPLTALKEMARVLRPGGIVLSVTPFMQPYHGYPNHYQNLTLTGHEYYYKSVGFDILESGVVVGPTVSVIFILSKWILNYLPAPLAKLFASIFLLFGIPLAKLIDYGLRKHKNSHVICSTSYILAKKPII